MNYKVVSFNNSILSFTSPNSVNEQLSSGLYFSRFQNHKYMYNWTLALSRHLGVSVINLVNADRHHDKFIEENDKEIHCGNWLSELEATDDLSIQAFQLYPAWFVDWGKFHCDVGRRSPKETGADNSVISIFRQFVASRKQGLKVLTIDYDYFILKHTVCLRAEEAANFPGKIVGEDMKEKGYNNYVKYNYVLDERSNYGSFTEADITAEALSIFRALIRFRVRLDGINLTTSLTEIAGSHLYDSDSQEYIDPQYRGMVDRALSVAIGLYVDWYRKQKQ